MCQIVTSTEIQAYGAPRVIVMRPLVDLLWLQRALQMKYYARIVPPLTGCTCMFDASSQ